VLEKFLLIALVHFVGIISPGPCIIGTLQNVIKNGKNTAKNFALGVALADAIFILLGGLGVVNIFFANKLLTNIFYCLSSAYLMYLGLMTIIKPTKITQSNVLVQKVKFNNAFLNGFYITIVNPASAIFYSTIISFYFNENAGDLFYILAAIYMMFASFLIIFFIALLFNLFRDKILKYINVFNYFAGAVIIYFAILIFIKIL